MIRRTVLGLVLLALVLLAAPAHAQTCNADACTSPDRVVNRTVEPVAEPSVLNRPNGGSHAPYFAVLLGLFVLGSTLAVIVARRRASISAELRLVAADVVPEQRRALAETARR
ncbi:MAG TPA: hypothetical protein VF711_14265 [Acidimicrobiales bacterium]|jgi:hypothetical protein